MEKRLQWEQNSTANSVIKLCAKWDGAEVLEVGLQEDDVMDELKRLSDLKYEEFFRDYMEANQLCIFSSELTKHWRSRKEWVINGRPNFGFFMKEFGNSALILMLAQHLREVNRLLYQIFLSF